MRVCAEKNCRADISNRRGNATLCLECAKNRYRECERAYFKSSKGKAAQKKYRPKGRNPQAPRPAEGVRKIILQQAANAAASLSFPALRAYLASAKGKAAMKRYRQSAKGQAASRAARKKYIESPKGRATLQALRERNKEHQKAYRESPRAGHGLRSRMGE